MKPFDRMDDTHSRHQVAKRSSPTTFPGSARFQLPPHVQIWLEHGNFRLFVADSVNGFNGSNERRKTGGAREEVVDVVAGSGALCDDGGIILLYVISKLAFLW